MHKCIIDIIDNDAIQVVCVSLRDVPCHQEVLRVHQNHFCRRASAEGRGFQSDKHETQRGTLQVYQAALRVWDMCPTCQRFHAFRHAGPRLRPTCAQCVVPVVQNQ